MYEQRFKGLDDVRDLRLSQGRRNEYEMRGLCSAIESHLTYRSTGNPLDMTLRFEYSAREYGTTFRAVRIRRAEHFPFIVPELVDANGNYMLITYLSYGSLLRLLSTLSH